MNCEAPVIIPATHVDTGRTHGDRRYFDESGGGSGKAARRMAATVCLIWWRPSAAGPRSSIGPRVGSRQKMEDSRDRGPTRLPALDSSRRRRSGRSWNRSARSAPDVEGIVDFYIMPAYDDIARLFFYDDGWHIHHVFPDRQPSRPVARWNSSRSPERRSRAVLEAMMQPCRMTSTCGLREDQVDRAGTFVERDSPSTGCWDEAHRDPTILTGRPGTPGYRQEHRDVWRELTSSACSPNSRRASACTGRPSGRQSRRRSICWTGSPPVAISRPIASQTPMRCESIGTPWCMSGTREWLRSRSRKLGDLCAVSSRSCRRPGDHD